ncbi:hypothetical protein [Haloarchaeobius sp. HRN-SO-5]|uniref:hypothetical protein n=1 Tax=Haloarchaeobius sp. HRN-SO-5 TaxID=3446118 RepID=UPI003EB8F848
MKRRTVVRLLVGLGVGIPVAIESATLFGLVFGDGDGGSDAPETTVASPGSTVLPETGPTERIDAVERTDAGVRVEVSVANDTREPYELRLTGVETADGGIVSETVSTGRIPAGEARSVGGEWAVPADTDIVALHVTAVTYGANAVITNDRRAPIAVA